jgi:hypothetical protein
LNDPGSENGTMSTPPDDKSLQLLLADADDYHPALADGVPTEAAHTAPKLKKPLGRAGTFLRDKPDGDVNDLAEQRWGIVAPVGHQGDRLLDAVAPLIRLREAEQGAPARIYRAPAEMTAKIAVRFQDDVYYAEDVPEHERPRYLMLLGDLPEVSLDLQHALANGALVGRVAFSNAAGEADLDAYAAYAEKVVDFSRHPSPNETPDAYFFAARDGSAATATALAQLIRPSLADAEAWRSRGGFPAASISEIAGEDPLLMDPHAAPDSGSQRGIDELLRAAAGARPAVLLSVSHGLGAPRGGWKSESQQRALQGALALGGKDVLSADELGQKRFLPGGMWFCVACFGAGTPAASVYHSWLSLLAKEGAHEGRLDAVLKSLPKPGEAPFVAALPQAALANPDGPLAVIGHVDLAWTYAFSGGKGLTESRRWRILSAVKVLVNGSRAGVGLDALMRFYRETTDTLRASYQAETDARTWNRPDPTDPKDRGHLWMLSNDLRGYVLLGDPAARLPLRRPTDGAPAVKPSAAPSAPAEVSVAPKEEVILALLHGDETPRALAARAGVSLKELWAWFDAYRAGGRARLGG